MPLRRATYRLYPTQEVSRILHYHRRLHKELYNSAVCERKVAYQKFGKSVSYFDQQNNLPAFKEVWTEYKNINSQALQATIKRVDFAFCRFFKGLSKYPKFKSIRNYSGWSYPSFTGWKSHSTGDNGYLELAKIGQVQMRGKARLWGTPKALDIIYRHGKWYASIVLEIDETLLKNNRHTTDSVIAIDLGCTDAIAWSNGTTAGLVAAPRFLRKAELEIKRLSKRKRRKRSSNYKKKVKASRRWKQAQKRISKIYRNVANQRQNWVHQETAQIVSCNRVVVNEKLEVKKMSAKAKKRRTPVGFPDHGSAPRQGKSKKQKAGLNKSILDVGMGMIRSSLKAKLDDVNGLFVEAPTRQIKPSQTCPNCGHQKKKTLDQRIHECESCGYIQQRDIASCEVLLLWYSNNLSVLGTSIVDAELPSSTTKTRKTAGSMRQLGALKRQKSTLIGLDAETSPSTK
jgi:putative transposase